MTRVFTDAEYRADASKVIGHAADAGCALVAREDGRPRVVIAIPAAEPPDGEIRMSDVSQLFLGISDALHPQRRRAERPARPKPPSIAQRFAAFDAAHPEVYAELRRLALEGVAGGRKRLGAKELWEVARWHLRLRTGAKPYRLNNSYTALYARKLMDHEPQLDGVFETRRRRAG